MPLGQPCRWVAVKLEIHVRLFLKIGLDLFTCEFECMYIVRLKMLAES